MKRRKRQARPGHVKSWGLHELDFGFCSKCERKPLGGFEQRNDIT